MGGVLGSRIFLRAKNIDRNQPGVKTKSQGRLRVYRMGSTTGVSYGGSHGWVQRARSKRSLLCSCQHSPTPLCVIFTIASESGCYVPKR